MKLELWAQWPVLVLGPSAASSWRQNSQRIARLRLLLVDAEARGLGIGARLVDECIRLAREARYRKITLWTHSILTAAALAGGPEYSGHRTKFAQAEIYRP